MDSVLGAQLSAAMHTAPQAVNVASSVTVPSVVSNHNGSMDETLTMENCKANLDDNDCDRNETIIEQGIVTGDAAQSESTALATLSSASNSCESVDGATNDASPAVNGAEQSVLLSPADGALQQQAPAWLSASDVSLTRQLEEQVPASAVSDELASPHDSQLSLSSPAADNRWVV